MTTQHIVSALVLAIHSLVVVEGRMYIGARDVTDIVTESITIATANASADGHDVEADAIVDHVRFALDERAWAQSKRMQLAIA